jgi:hypothetical protein
LSARLILLAGLLGAAGVAALLWWWFVLCERDCAAEDRHAQDLFQRGELLQTLGSVSKVEID